LILIAALISPPYERGLPGLQVKGSVKDEIRRTNQNQVRELEENESGLIVTRKQIISKVEMFI